mmetsp:Transcript_23550/g.30041  ORF Transcript_23550/g.30041 Transcript_23550/m.30041 type:complete len:251 (-) Transcript_23550:421-1173(-)
MVGTESKEEIESKNGNNLKTETKLETEIKGEIETRLEIRIKGEIEAETKAEIKAGTDKCDLMVPLNVSIHVNRKERLVLYNHLGRQKTQRKNQRRRENLQNSPNKPQVPHLHQWVETGVNIKTGTSQEIHAHHEILGAVMVRLLRLKNEMKDQRENQRVMTQWISTKQTAEPPKEVQRQKAKDLADQKKDPEITESEGKRRKIKGSIQEQRDLKYKAHRTPGLQKNHLMLLLSNAFPFQSHQSQKNKTLP